MPTYGRETLSGVGRSIQVSADGDPQAKAGGVTVDWSTIAATTVDQTFLDIDFVASGEKFIRYGQVLCKITASGLYGPYSSGASDGRQTLTKGNCYVVNESVHMNQPHSDHPPVIDGGRVWKKRLLVQGIDEAGTGTNEVVSLTINATGGTFTLTYNAHTTSAIAWNATPAVVQAALEALADFDPGDVTVTGTPATATTVGVYSMAFMGQSENTDLSAFTTGAGSLTGGAGTAVVAVTTSGVNQPSLANFETAFPNFIYVPE